MRGRGAWFPVLRDRLKAGFLAQRAREKFGTQYASQKQVPPLRRRWRSGFGRDDNSGLGGDDNSGLGGDDNSGFGEDDKGWVERW